MRKAFDLAAIGSACAAIGTALFGIGDMVATGQTGGVEAPIAATFAVAFAICCVGSHVLDDNSRNGPGQFRPR